MSFLQEDLDADHVLLEVRLPAGDRLRDDERQKALEAVGLLEGLAPENALQLLLR